ncbi:hypothetical protein ASD15_23765 [Massilia sp. Root351]|jgi:hypothetical protein|uniref:hypothetical protein n=1 Tax=Massilia sp. Root351 TaxID=1736522 RepID=UPI00070A82D4|nr:hypothetical protein [Massilia sp. Root351]KQV90330.1 hypothetical protein ASD15_23765 [Massilia sp. Root351]
MKIASFEDLLAAAAAQDQPQRLLFAFSMAESAPGHRGADAPQTLIPVMCADKAPEDVASFGQLAGEAAEIGAQWDMVMVSALSGAAGAQPPAGTVEQALRRMLRAIQDGQLDWMLAFDRQGRLLRPEPA